MAPTFTKGLHKATARVADGSTRTYWYAWKGGPRLDGEPGSPEFRSAHAAAVAERRGGATHGILAGLIIAYRQSPEFADLADSTRKERSRFLDLIQDCKAPLAIGGLPAETLADPRVKQHFLAWRDQWRATPRKADYAIQVLSAVMSWAVGRGRVSANVLLGHSTLYKANRAELIWSADEVAKFAAAAPSLEVGFIVRLACLTGLRRADLLRLEWSHVGEIAIVLTPNKSRRRRRPRTVTVPLLDETLALLAEIRLQQDRRWTELAAAASSKRRPSPPRPTTVLSNTRGGGWSKDGAEHQVIETKRKVGIEKHLHDCRGSFATRLRVDGATSSEIADILGWEEARVERLLSLYVDTNTVVRAFAERIRAKSAARRQS